MRDSIIEIGGDVEVTRLLPSTPRWRFWQTREVIFRGKVMYVERGDGGTRLTVEDNALIEARRARWRY